MRTDEIVEVLEVGTFTPLEVTHGTDGAGRERAPVLPPGPGRPPALPAPLCAQVTGAAAEAGGHDRAGTRP